VVGGPKKALKTSTLVDLVLSLGSGEPFLGHFPVARRCATALISDESGEATLQETAFRVCLAKGIRLEDTTSFWDFRLPQLSVATELDELSKGLAARKIEVAVIDPLYLCLLKGAAEGSSKSASNLFDMGPFLMEVARACLDAGTTPILVHHAKKYSANPGDPLDLEDLAFAGVHEFARQWHLLSRRNPYRPGSVYLQLWLSAGGSAEHSGLYGLDINEGVVEEDFGGRTWSTWRKCKAPTSEPLGE
jgi:AAA domain